MNTQRFFIYARKSTDDTTRQVRSINDQLAEVRELADREHLEIADIFIERQTAKSPGRPMFNEMLSRIEKGEANGIMAWHPDRLSRNPIDGGRIIYLVDTGKIVDLKFPTFRFEPTAQGKFMLSIMLSQSKYYVDNLSENVKRGKRQKVKNGIWPAGAPVGYLNDRATRTIVPNPKSAPLIKKIFDLYATGDYTLKQVRETINGIGFTGKYGEPAAISTIQNVLQNPIYYGLFRYNGELYEGKHEPIISKALFDKCQEVMRNKSRPKKPKYKPFLYRGMIRCGECGGLITMEEQKGHHYLRCTKKKGPCSQPYLREEKVAAQVSEQIRRVEIPNAWAEWFFEEIDRTRADETEASQKYREQLRQELALCDTRLARLTNAFLDQIVSGEEYKQTKNKIILEKRQIQESIEVFGTKVFSWLEPFRRFIKASNQASCIADSGDCTTQWDFLRKVGSNLTLRGGTLLWDARGVWQSVLDKEVMVLQKRNEWGESGVQAAEKFESTIKSG
jgi:DNA invertase Pin-like site-specific DNA recombinase